MTEPRQTYEVRDEWTDRTCQILTDGGHGLRTCLATPTKEVEWIYPSGLAFVETRCIKHLEQLR